MTERHFEPDPLSAARSAARYDDLLRRALVDAEFEADNAPLAQAIRMVRDVVGSLREPLANSPDREQFGGGLNGEGHTVDPCLPELPARFQVAARLGSGSFGTVVQAWDTVLQRDVAIKIPHPQLCTATAVHERFLRESRAVARLNHPHIVRVLDGGEFQGIPFFVSEFVEGTSLSRVIAGRGPLMPSDAATLTASLADAVHHAHERGVLHRDIKPDNILIECIADATADFSCGIPRLTDFGLARIMDDEMHRSVAGTVIGTPWYMAPEQLIGDPADLSPAVDVFSLGTVLFELLTGHGPFSHHNTIQQRILSLDQPVTFPRHARQLVPSDLVSICLKCLERNPKHRYATAAELRDDLRRYLDGRPTVARPLGLPEQILRWSRRNQGLAAATGLLVFACLAIAAVTGHSWSVVHRQNTQLQAALQESRAQTRLARDFSEQARQEHTRALNNESRYRAAALLSALQQGFAEYNGGNLLQADRFATRAEQLAEGQSRPEVAMLRSAVHREFRTVCHSDTGVFEHCQVPGSERIVAAGAKGSVQLLDLNGTVLRSIQLRIPEIHAITTSSDGRRIIAGGSVDPVDDTAWIVIADLLTGEELRAFAAAPTTIESLAISSDERFLLCGPRYEPVRLFDLQTGECRLVGGDRRNQSVRFCESSRHAVINPERNALVLLATDRVFPPQIIPVPAGVVAFDVDEQRRLAAVIQSRSIDLLIVDLANGQAVAVLEDAQPWAGSISFSPDGEWIACGALDGTIRVWKLPDCSSPATNSGPTGIPEAVPALNRQVHNSRVVSVSWTDDGRIVSSGEDGTITVLTPPSADSSLMEPDFLEGVGCVAAAPGVLVLGFEDSSICLDQTPHPASQTKMESDVRRRVISTATAQSGLLTAVAISHSGGVAAAGYENGDVRLLSADGTSVTGVAFDRQVTASNGESSVMDLCFAPDDSAIFWTGEDNRVRTAPVVAAQGAEQFLELVSTGWSIEFSPDGRRLAVGGAFEEVLVVDPRSLQVVSTLFGGTHCPACRFSRDGTRLLTSHTDGTLRGWSVSDGSPLFSIRISAVPVRDFAVSADERIAVAINESGTVIVTDLVAGEVVGRLKGLSAGSVAAERRPFLIRSEWRRSIIAGVFGPDESFQHAEWPFP